MTYAVETIDLTRVFKRGKSTIKALDNVNISIRKGEIFGLLGPNGAGKTTLIRILATLLLPTSGEAYVNGYDVIKEPDKVREIINIVSGGERAGYGILTVRENLWYYSQLYGYGLREGWKKVDELINLLDMKDFANVRLNRLSTGMIQKYNLARGLINDPKILFLDEPTLGLDVEVARYIRKIIKNLVREKPDKTILLTTHYMAEAEQLCDRIAIIHKGRIIAEGTSDDLKHMVSKEKIFKVEVRGIVGALDYIRKINGVKALTYKGDIVTGVTSIRLVLSDNDLISKIVEALNEKRFKVLSVVKVEPTLEDVFLKLVGARLVE